MEIQIVFTNNGPIDICNLTIYMHNTDDIKIINQWNLNNIDEYVYRPMSWFHLKANGGVDKDCGMIIESTSKVVQLPIFTVTDLEEC